MKFISQVPTPFSSIENLSPAFAGSSGTRDPESINSPFDNGISYPPRVFASQATASAG